MLFFEEVEEKFFCPSCGKVMKTRIQDELIQISPRLVNPSLYIDCYCEGLSDGKRRDYNKVLLVCPDHVFAVTRCLAE